MFEAWTSPEVMRRWLHPWPDGSTPEAEVDLRVGGAVRVVMRRSDGWLSESRGSYAVIEPPHRLVMRWTFQEDPTNEQLIEVTFSEVGGETTVVLVNTDISTDARRESQLAGWRGCLEQLARFIERTNTNEREP